MCALHVSPLPMFRPTPKAQAPYSATQNRTRPEPFPLRVGAAERLSVEQFPKRRRAPDDDYESLQPQMRSSYPSSPLPSRAIQYSGSGYNPALKSSRSRDAMYQGPAQHDHYGGFDEARSYPSAEPPRGHRIPHARSASASLPGLSSILQSSNSPQQPQEQQYQRPLRHPDAPPISVALTNQSNSSASHPQQRTMSWSSNGSPHESPLFTRSAVGAVRPPHWGPAVASETRQREMRDAYGSFYHDHQQRLSQPHQFVNRRVPTNGHASPSSSLSGEELLDTGDADHANPAVTGALAGGNKNSRYLREMDRRAILERLANGEKQAALAKEFQVSRAAICNLNKHRDEVMSRADENPFAKHPKKRKVRVASVKPANEASTATVPTVEDQSMPAKDEEGPEVESLVIKAVHVVQSRAVQLLMTTLRSHTTPQAEFRRCSDRVLRLVLEDALALVPTTPVDVYLNDQVKVEGVGRQHALCGISLEQRHCPVMDMFHVIEPDQPTGYVRCNNGDVTLLDAHLPASLASHNVFLFDLVAASGETVCATLEQLLARGAVESRLYVVALFVASDVVAAVQCTFPRVHIVTAQIDASLNAGQKSRRRSDTGRLDDMLARFAEVYNVRM